MAKYYPTLEEPPPILSGHGGPNGSNRAPGGTAPGGKFGGIKGLDEFRNGSNIIPPPVLRGSIPPKGSKSLRP